MNQKNNNKNTADGFERFIKPSTRFYKPRAALASLIKKDILAINCTACSAHNILDYAYYVSFYDRNTGRIGLMFTNDEKEPGARTFGHRKGYAHLCFHNFVEHYGIDRAKNRFSVSEGTNRMLILEPVEEGK